MYWTVLLAGGLLGCVDKATSDSATDTDDRVDTAEEDACKEVSYAFNTGPTDQLPECFGELTQEVQRLAPGGDLSNSGSGSLDPALTAQAVLAPLHGQLNGYLQTQGKSSQDTYEAVCERLVNATAKQPPPHGDGPEEICNNAEKWAQSLGLGAYYSCEPVWLSEAMTTVLGGTTGIDQSEAFWARVFADNGTNPNLIWLPMFLAMHHGGSPSVLAYRLPKPAASTGESEGQVAILELGLEVQGPQPVVDDFWKFIDSDFDPNNYTGSSGDFSALTITIPSRLTWRDGDTISTWELGQAIPEPFDQQFVTASGLIDPCRGDRAGKDGFGAGGAAGECFNSYERMMAVVHELSGITSFTGTAAKTCDRTAFDFTLP